MILPIKSIYFQNKLKQFLDMCKYIPEVTKLALLQESAYIDFYQNIGNIIELRELCKDICKFYTTKKDKYSI